MVEKWNAPVTEKSFDVLSLVAGLFLLISPWLVGFAAESAAWNAWIVGAAIALVAAGALVAFAQWEEWVNLLLGLWAAISPWLLGFADLAYATYAHVVVGLIVAVAAAGKLWHDNHRESAAA